VAWAEQYLLLRTVGKTMGEYEKELLAIKLTNKDMARIVEKGGVEMTITEWTALEMYRVAKLLGIEKMVSFISIACRNLPDAIRQKVSSNHDSWKEFTDAVQEVDREYLAEAAEKAAKEKSQQREQDQIMAWLNNMIRMPDSPTKAI
jgi:DNA topoisomerase VI subunit B